MTEKTFSPTELGFGETLSLAESLGWKDWYDEGDDPWTEELADALQEDAINFICNSGYRNADETEIKNYTVVARMTTALTIDIKAKNLEEAEKIARNTDGGDFTEIPQSVDWEIYSVVETNA